MTISKLLAALLLILPFVRVKADVRLPHIVRDSMVLQRDTKINIWGWASPGEKVTVRFNKKIYRATAGTDGKWKAVLEPVKAGGPYAMNIDGNNHLVLNQILVGDVWLCSGQSNMVHQMALHEERYATDIRNANFSEIRQFWVPNTTNLQTPQEDLPFGNWKSANPVDVRDFSAVAYFFARKIYQQYHIPIGLINASWGGSPIEAWLSEDGLQDFSAILNTVKKNKDTAYVNGTNRRAVAVNRGPALADRGINEKWFDPSYQVNSNWRRINIPGYWEDQGVKDLDGIVWYRREFDIPASMTAGTARLFLGRIVDADNVYINGKLVGNTSYLYPQRKYTVPAGVLKPGRNVFVIRVINNAGKGGFVPDKPYILVAGNDTLDLKGYWQYRVGNANPPRSGFVSSIDLQNQPTALYNSMIAPIQQYTIKGILWYQGETNAGRPAEYEKLQPALIADWRNKWKNPGAPFLYVQLPGFMDMTYQPVESSWAAFREAQRKSLAVPNTAMAVAIDLGEWNDVHPDRKKEVGDRLALAAEKLVYGEKDLVASGPLYYAATREGNKIVLDFTNVGSGLITNDGEEPAEFAIAGADKKFVWAKARIEGGKIVVWNDLITNPQYVRYAWSDFPVQPNLFNKEGLPASPFQAQVLTQ